MEDNIFSDVSSLNSSLQDLKNNPLALQLAKKSGLSGCISDESFLANSAETSKVQSLHGNINKTLEELFPKNKRDKRLWTKSFQKKSDQSSFSFCINDKNILKNIQHKNDLTVNLTFTDSDNSCNETVSKDKNLFKKLPLKNKYSVNIDLNDTESSIDESIKNPFRKPYNPPNIDLSLSTTELSITSDKTDVSNQENFDPIQNSDEFININVTRDLTIDEPNNDSFISNKHNDATFTISGLPELPDKKCKVSEKTSSFISSNDTFTICNSVNFKENLNEKNMNKKKIELRETHYFDIGEEMEINCSQNNAELENSINIDEKLSKRKSDEKCEELVNKKMKKTPHRKKSKENEISECLQKNELNCTQNMAENEEKLKKNSNITESHYAEVNKLCTQNITTNEKLNKSANIAENEEKLEETFNKNAKNNNISECPIESNNHKVEEIKLNLTQDVTEKCVKSSLKKRKLEENPNNTDNELNNSSGCPESSHNQEIENDVDCHQNIAKNDKLEAPNLIGHPELRNDQDEDCSQNKSKNGEKLKNSTRLKKGKLDETYNLTRHLESSRHNQEEEIKLDWSQNKSKNGEKLEKSVSKNASRHKLDETQNLTVHPESRHNEEDMEPDSSQNIVEKLEKSMSGNEGKRESSRLSKGKLNKTQNLSLNNIEEEMDLDCSQNKSRKLEKSMSGNEGKRESSRLSKGKLNKTQNLSLNNIEEEMDLDCSQNKPRKFEKSMSGNEGKRESSRLSKGKLNKTQNLSFNNIEEEMDLDSSQNKSRKGEKLEKSMSKNDSRLKKEKLDETQTLTEHPESTHNQGEEIDLDCSQNKPRKDEKLEKSMSKNDSRLKKGKLDETQTLTEHPKSSHNQEEEMDYCSQNKSRKGEKLEKSMSKNDSRLKKGKLDETQTLTERPESTHNQGEEMDLISQNKSRKGEKLEKSMSKNDSRLKKGKLDETQNLTEHPESRHNQGEEIDLISQNKSRKGEKLEKSMSKNDSRLKKGKLDETQNLTEHPESRHNQEEEIDLISQNKSRKGEKLEKSMSKNDSRLKKGKLDETETLTEHPESTHNQGEEIDLDCSQNKSKKCEKLEKSMSKDDSRLKKRKLDETQNLTEHPESMHNQEDKEPDSTQNAENCEKLEKSMSGNKEKRESSRLSKAKLNKTQNLSLNIPEEKMELDCSQNKSKNGEKYEKSMSKNASRLKKGKLDETQNLTEHPESIGHNQEEMELDCTQNIAENGGKLKKSMSKNDSRLKKGKLDKTQNKKNLSKSLNENELNCSNKKGKFNEQSNNISSSNTTSELSTSSNNILLRNTVQPKISTITCKSVPKESYDFQCLELIENEKSFKELLPKDINVSSEKQDFAKPLEREKRLTRSSKNKDKSINDSSYENEIDISSIREHNPRKKLLIYHSTPINKVPINSTTESTFDESNKFKQKSQSMSEIHDLTDAAMPSTSSLKNNVTERSTRSKSSSKINTISNTPSLVINETNERSNRSSTSINTISNTPILIRNETIRRSNRSSTLNKTNHLSLSKTTLKTRSSSKMTDYTTDILSSESESDDTILDSSESDTETIIEKTQIRKYNKIQKRDSVFGPTLGKIKKPKNNQLVLPKLYKPCKWINKKLYDYLERKLKNIHKLKTRIVSEEFAILLYHTYTLTMHGHDKAIDDLKNKSKEIGLCETNIDFFMFIYEYTPFEFRKLVLPMGGAYGTKCSPVKINLYEKL